MAEITDEEALQVVQLQTMAVMCYLEDDHLSQRSYIRPIFARRKEQGDFYHLVRELELADNEYFCRYARFSPALLEDVLQLVGPRIQHSQIHFFTSQINLSSVFSIVFFRTGLVLGNDVATSDWLDCQRLQAYALKVQHI